MKTIPNEIQAYHNLAAEIGNMEAKLKNIETDVINKYCPFKVGDKVVYKCFYKSKATEDFGIICSIRFKGVNSSAVDNKWIIHIKRTKKDFMPIKNNIDHVWDTIGNYELDTIRKY